MSENNIGSRMHSWAQDLYPICRSITGPGVRETLSYLSSLLPDLEIYSVPSGTQAFDWTVPDEWVIRDAYIANENGQRVIDFKKHNLHVVSYSEQVDCWLDRDELDQYLYSLPEQPNAIPYVTSYYGKCWGFCLTHKQREALARGKYHVVIDSELKPGELNYGELIIPGNSTREIFLSTYICHPSMANNELSGPVVTTALAQWLSQMKERRYTYRIVFIPETIGSLVYLSKNIEHLKRLVVAGYNITCIGDERAYSYLPSRQENTLADKVALHVLQYIDPNFKRYTWLDRGSDERQYCAPGVDLPIATIMRSKYGEYPEYHTSLDDLNLVTPTGLEQGYLALKSAIEVLEQNIIPKVTVYGEPQLGKRGLYPSLSAKGSAQAVATMMDVISYCDGDNTILEIAEIVGVPFQTVRDLISQLVEHNLIQVIDMDDL